MELALTALVDAVVALVAHGGRGRLADRVGIGGVEFREGALVARDGLVGDLLVADAAERRRGAFEALLDDLVADAQCLEDVRAAVAEQRADAHLGHDLQQAGLDGGLVILFRLRRGDRRGGLVGGREVADRGERQVRINGSGAVADQAGDVVDVTRLARLGDEVALEADAGVDELRGDRAHREEHGDGDLVAGDTLVGEDDDARAVGLHGTEGAGGDVLEGVLERVRTGGRVEEYREAGDAAAEELDLRQRDELVVEQHRRVKRDEAVEIRGLLEDVQAAADAGLDRHDGLLANRVDRRVGDLREELLEILVQQARAAREDGERRVVAHRADGFLPFRQRREDQLEFVEIVTERELLLERGGDGRGWRGAGRRVAVDLGELVEVDEVLLVPIAVGKILHDRGLDVRVGEELLLLDVDGDHAARPEAAGLDDLAREVGHDAGLGGEDDVAVVIDLVARRAQAVAVEGGADETAVGENERGGAVPRLHQVRVVAIEVPEFGGELLVLLPRHRDHHHHRVERRAAAEDEGLENVVEAGRVGHARLDDRVQVGEARAPDTARHRALAGVHAHAVAADGVDLAVVRHGAERLGQVPCRERVRRIALVEDREGRLVALVAEVGEELADLRGVEEALVDDGAVRERADVETVDARVGAAALGDLLREEELLLELGVRDVVEAGDESLRDDRDGLGGLAAQDGNVDRHLAPGNEGETLFLDRLDDDLAGVGLGQLVAAREEDHADAEVLVGGGGLLFLLEVGAENLVRQLREHAGAVAGDGVRIDGAAMGQRFQGGQGAGKHVVAAFARDAGDHADATGVMFKLGIIERRWP